MDIFSTTTIAVLFGVEELSGIWIGDNTLLQYFGAAILLVLYLFGFYILRHFVLRSLARFADRTPIDIDNTLVRIVSGISLTVYLVLAFSLSLFYLDLPSWFDTTLKVVLLFLLVKEAVRAAGVLVEYVTSKRISPEHAEDRGTRASLEFLKLLVKGILWVLGFLLILSNLGIEVTSLIAGLGIGGIAIGIALQAILGDLFSSFAIYFDKPFKVGDFIIVGDKMGTVEKVGIKTTRIRALGGEQIVFSNADLTSSRIQNYQRMEKRRAVFEFALVYETPTDTLRRVPDIVREAVTSTGNTDFDRAHLNSFGSYALQFEAVYYVLSSDYNQYMDINQEIHQKIKEKFDQEGITFAKLWPQIINPS